MLLMLTWAAGTVDAISYLGLGRVFTAMMTGNTVLLALAVSEGESMAVMRSVLALAGFSAGAAAGALIVMDSDERGEWPSAVTHALAFEGLLLGVFAVVWYSTQMARTTGITNILIVLSGLAMGIQAAAVRHVRVPGVATTYITGTLTSLMADLVGWLRSMSASSSRATPADQGRHQPSPGVNWEERVGLLSAVFLVYGLGALVGGILLSRSSTLATLLPLVAVALVATRCTGRAWVRCDVSRVRRSGTLKYFKALCDNCSINPFSRKNAHTLQPSPSPPSSVSVEAGTAGAGAASGRRLSPCRAGVGSSGKARAGAPAP